MKNALAKRTPGYLCAIGLLMLLARPAGAQSTSTWSGLGTNNLWGTNTNWQGNVGPTTSPNTAIILTGSAQTTIVHNLGNFSLNSLTFASEAAAFTINQATTDFFNFAPTTGSVLPHIDQFSAANQTINFPNSGLLINGDLLLGGTGSGTLSITGQLAIGGAIPHLVLNGPYTVSLSSSATSTISGIVVNAGTLRVASDISIGNGPLTFGGGALQLINNLNLSHAIVLSGAGTIDANGFAASMPTTTLTVTGAGRLTLTNSNGTGAFNIASQLQQTGGLTVSGANNTVTLSGTNTYGSGTTISGGAVLSIDNDARLGSGGGAINFDNGTLRLSSTASYSSARGINLNSGGGVIEVTSPQPAIGLTGAISGAGSLTKTGPGRIGLLAANTYTGTTNVNAGFLDIVHNQAVQNSTVNLNGGSVSFFSPASAPVFGGLAGSGNISFTGFPGSLTVGNNNASTTYSGNLSGGLSGGLSKVGTGTWTLSGTNTLTGPLNIQAGTVVANSAGAFSPNGQINLSAGATLDLNSFTFAPLSGTSVLGGTVRLNFGSLAPVVGATIGYNGATLSNGFISGGGQHIFNATNTLNNITAFNGSHLVQSGFLSLNNSTLGGSVNIGGTVDWNNGSLTSSGNLTISNTANFNGVTSNGKLTVSGGINTGTLNVNGSSLVLGGGSTTFVGFASEPGGTINLNGQSIDLRGGLLVNNGQIVNGTTNVGFGALAKGGGVYGPVNVTDGGKFSPGNSPGSVTTGATTWNSGGSYVVEIGNDASDFWAVDGILDVDASAAHPFTISLASIDELVFDNTRDQTWRILSANGGIAGLNPSEIVLDTSEFKNSLGSGHFTLQSTADELSVQFSAVPEPSVLMIAVAGLLISAGRLRLLVRRPSC